MRADLLRRTRQQALLRRRTVVAERRAAAGAPGARAPTGPDRTPEQRPDER